MNKKRLLTSVMSIAMLASITTGATYALFTAEDTANIAVTAGKVSVKANVGSITHYSNGIVQDGQWENGGKATFEGNNVTLDRITPGDKVEIKLEVTNLSNVAAAYRTLVDVIKDEGLASGLLISVSSDSGNVVSSKGTAYRDWSPLSGEGVVEELTITIELPLEAGNEYQEKSATIKYYVEAVQGNASLIKTTNGLLEETIGEETFVYINNATDLKIFAANVNKEGGSLDYSNKIIKLTNNIDLENDYWTPIGTAESDKRSFIGIFDGNGKTISNFVVNETNGAGLFGAIEFKNENKSIVSSVKNLTIDNATIYGNHYAGGIVGYIYGDIKGCTVKNSTIALEPSGEEGNYSDGDKAGGLVGWASMTRIENNKVDNVSISAYRDLGGLVGCISDNNSTNDYNKIIGNEVKDVTLSFDTSGKIVDGDVHENIGEVIGRQLKPNIVENNTVTNVNIVGIAADDDALEESTDETSKVVSISTAEQFAAFANAVNNGNTYKNYTVSLKNDIDLKGAMWTPIGNTNNSKVDNVFAGTFDGNNHTVKNLVSYGEKNVGLFAFGNSATIKNLVVENAIVKGSENVGVIVGAAYTAKIENCHVKGHVELSSNYKLGPITGYTYSSVIDCSVDVDSSSFVTCTYLEADLEGDNVGGIVGFVAEANNPESLGISNCHSNINVTGTRKVGGIAGSVEHNRLVENCSYVGTVKTNTSAAYDNENVISVAGIVGESIRAITIRNCSVLSGTVIDGTSDIENNKACTDYILGRIRNYGNYSVKLENNTVGSSVIIK